MPAKPQGKSSKWEPRPPTSNGGSMFIKTFDGLATAMIAAQFEHAASWACLIAIHYRVQRDYQKRPQAITVREFAEATGYWKSMVQLALAELEGRGIIKVTRGHGRRASLYEVEFYTCWEPVDR